MKGYQQMQISLKPLDPQDVQACDFWGETCSDCQSSNCMTMNKKTFTTMGSTYLQAKIFAVGIFVKRIQVTIEFQF